MQRATVVQLNYVVDHPIVGENSLSAILLDKRHLLILAGI